MNNTSKESNPQPAQPQPSPPPTVQRPQVDTGKFIEKSQSGNDNNKKIEK